MTTYAWPAGGDWEPSAVELTLLPNNRTYTSIYTGQQQSIALPGERWRFAITLPARSARQAPLIGGAREAFFSRLRGTANKLEAWHFARPQPRGTLRGSPVLSSIAAQGAESLAITTTAGATLRAGDMLGCNGQLFMVAADCTANGSGAITVPVVNRVRFALSASTPVVWDRPTAECLLSAPVPASYTPGVIQATVVELVETW